MESLRLEFCKQNRLNPASFKFLYDGQRIHDDDTANSLGMENGDTIEVFYEMRGGGRPHKKNMYGDTSKILNLLDRASDCEETSDSSSDDNEDDAEQPARQIMDLRTESSLQVPAEKTNSNEIKVTDCESTNENTLENKSTQRVHFESVDNKHIEHPSNDQDELEGDNVEIEQKGTKEQSKSDNETNSLEADIADSTIEHEAESDKLLKELRQDYQDGKLKKDNVFDLKIIHFLKIEKLAPVELNMLQTLVKRKEFFDNNDLFSEKVTKKAKKRKIMNVDVISSRKQLETRSKSCLTNDRINVESDTRNNISIGEAAWEDETDETCN